MIEIKNVKKSFENKKILQGANLHIRKGETLVIIGQSGGGKSVLLKHLIGLHRPDSGEIYIEDENILEYNEKQMVQLNMKIGMLFQGGALFDSLTVGENVAFPLLEHTKTDPDDIADIVKEKLAMVGMEGIEDLKPSELSGGMQKRVALARAVCENPQIMLYDEPTTGLDPIMADVINDLIIRLKKELNVTSIVVTHDMVSAYKIADRIAMLYEGRIIGVGTPDEIRNSQDPIIQQFINGRAEGPITTALNRQIDQKKRTAKRNRPRF